MPNQIENGVYRTNVQIRHARGDRMRTFYMLSLVVAIVALAALFYNIINQAFGLVAVDFEIREVELVGEGNTLEDLSTEELTDILVEYTPQRLLVITRDNLRGVPEDEFTRAPLSEAINGEVPEEFADLTITDLDAQQQAELLALNLNDDQLREIIEENVMEPTIEESWPMVESIFNRGEIEQRVQDVYPGATIEWRSWVSIDFITSPLSSTPALAGIRPAILGTIWLLLITIVVAFPLGVGASIYLEEYANHSLLNRLIELNIRNLAGVPSIIYGMLGLTIFVRILDPLTQGRTIISAGLTLALLILPIIIINAQEALRAVPSSIREGSYGLGATKWQTISRQVLPAAIPGILTGTILAMSRAIGETAPLIVVGAAAFISVDPSGPFSRFTALPILIYNWTAQPNDQFRNIAAAGIIVLLALLLTMNSVAIILRNRASKRRLA